MFSYFFRVLLWFFSDFAFFLCFVVFFWDVLIDFAFFVRFVVFFCRFAGFEWVLSTFSCFGADLVDILVIGVVFLRCFLSLDGCAEHVRFLTRRPTASAILLLVWSCYGSLDVHFYWCHGDYWCHLFTRRRTTAVCVNWFVLRCT